jgi:hypothetical protein
MNISISTDPNPMKQIALVQKLNYLSNATGPIFLGFLCKL